MVGVGKHSLPAPTVVFRQLLLQCNMAALLFAHRLKKKSIKNDCRQKNKKRVRWMAMFVKREIVERLRRQYPAGTRVKLVRMEDEQAPPIGTCGTVLGVDDLGSIMVSWDNGGSLSVVYGEDLCKKID